MYLLGNPAHVVVAGRDPAPLRDTAPAVPHFFDLRECMIISVGVTPALF